MYWQSQRDAEQINVYLPAAANLTKLVLQTDSHGV